VRHPRPTGTLCITLHSTIGRQVGRFDGARRERFPDVTKTPILSLPRDHLMCIVARMERQCETAATGHRYSFRTVKFGNMSRSRQSAHEVQTAASTGYPMYSCLLHQAWPLTARLNGNRHFRLFVSVAAKSRRNLPTPTSS
jgi:hypothetical protein